MDRYRGVGPGVVVWQGLEAELGPHSLWRGHLVVRVKPQPLPPGVEDEAVWPLDGGEVGLEGGQDVGPRQGGEVLVQQVPDCVLAASLSGTSCGEKTSHGKVFKRVNRCWIYLNTNAVVPRQCLWWYWVTRDQKEFIPFPDKLRCTPYQRISSIYVEYLLSTTRSKYKMSSAPNCQEKVQ